MDRAALRLLLILTAMVLTTPPHGEGASPELTPAEVTVAEVGHTRWTHGNSVRLLADPEESWQARLELIEQAEHHIHMTTFSWHNDHYGTLFRQRLLAVMLERLESNPEFKVYVLVDATSRGMFDFTFGRLEKAGAVVRSFNPNLWGIGPMYDVRMHDKMLIVDGRKAIVGGRNIANEYYDHRDWWLDFGVMLEGDSVWDLQMLFLKSWAMSSYLPKVHRFPLPPDVLRARVRSLYTTGRWPNGNSPLTPYLTAEYFAPVAEPPGDLRVAVLYDNPLIHHTAAGTETLIELIRHAEHRVDVMTPFPNFSHELTDAVADAAGRGVAVRLFVNGDEAAIRRGPFLRAGLPTLIELIGAGVEVWAWQGNGEVDQLLEAAECTPEIFPPKALHGKLALIDHHTTIVHSSNFNIRSTYYNTEAGVAVSDRAFNEQVRNLLDGLITLRELTLECGSSVDPVFVDRVVDRLDLEDIPRLRKILGNKQGYVDSMGVLW
jgi:phosphatidylserine/phosphatidylglycerophosphate/cardiolipin synthase-like enzyme